MDLTAYSKNFALLSVPYFRLNGKKLVVAINDNYEEAKKVNTGSVITVRYLGTNVHGTLQFPQFYRERTDVKWEDLINSKLTYFLHFT